MNVLVISKIVKKSSIYFKVKICNEEPKSKN